MIDILEDRYLSLLSAIKSLGGIDSKYDSFIELLQKIWMIKENKCQVIVFSFYIGTLKYLRKRLSDDGYRVALIYGHTPQETPPNKYDDDGFVILGRNEVMDRFKKGEYDILLASEVGGEGLDFQFCSALINYDIPYNPMRIEQRIGRIDRMGQNEDKIIIGNLCIDNTIDIIINRVLLERINEASVLIGDLEPIIAEEMEEINSILIRKNFSAEEIKQREKEMVSRIEKEKRQREEFDNIRYELVNDRAFRDEFNKMIISSRLSPEKSLMYTMSFLKTIKGCWSKKVSDTSAFIHVTKEIREKAASRYRIDPSEELKAVFTSKDNIYISFSGDEAYDTESTIFFKPSGAWIRFVTDYIKIIGESQNGGYYICEVSNKAVDIPKGQYYIFVYEMEFIGFHNNRFDEYIIIDSNSGEVISFPEGIDSIVLSMRNHKTNDDVCLDSYDDASMSSQDELEKRQSAYNSEIESVNNIKIKSRIEAIKSLSDSRIKELESELLSAVNSKEIEKLNRAIEHIRSKTEKNVSILSEKLKIASSYSLKAVCVLWVK